MAKSYWGLRDSCGYGGSTRAQLALAILADTAFMKISTIADLPPQLVLEWMRRLRDGKSLEAHWVLFRAVVVSPGTSPEQVDLLRAPLFAGAHRFESPKHPTWRVSYARGRIASREKGPGESHSRGEWSRSTSNEWVTSHSSTMRLWRQAKLLPGSRVKQPWLSARTQSFINVIFGLI